jgi:hypothetical protein
MAELENTTLGIKLVTSDPDQDMFDKYLDRLQGKQSMPVGKYYGEMVRAAIEVGWLIEPKWTPEQVGKQKPKVIRWLGEKLDRLYLQETTVPPE